jgi:hypothetical protein
MEKILELAKQAGIKAQSETALSPQELEFAKLLIEYCGQFIDANTRQIVFKHLGVANV